MFNVAKNSVILELHICIMNERDIFRVAIFYWLISGTWSKSISIITYIYICTSILLRIDEYLMFFSLVFEISTLKYMNCRYSFTFWYKYTNLSVEIKFSRQFISLYTREHTCKQWIDCLLIVYMLPEFKIKKTISHSNSKE